MNNKEAIKIVANWLKNYSNDVVKVMGKIWTDNQWQNNVYYVIQII